LRKAVKSGVAALVIAGIVSLHAASASACRCREPSTAAAYSAATLVVVAEAVEITRRPEIQGSTVKFRVQQAWKAAAPEFLDVVSATDCAYSVQQGETHLLFLIRDGDRYTTGRCMGNTPVSRGKAALAWLRKHGKSVAAAGRVR